MECTPATAVPASAPALIMAAPSLLAAFATVPDPRRQASVTYPLSALLALAVVAILARQLSLLAIAEWAARQGDAVLAPLGLAAGRTPAQSTLQRLFARLEADRLIDALAAHFQPPAAPDPQARGGQGVALDGKAQRGRLRFQLGGCPVHALTAFCHEHGVVLAQEPIDSTADKAEAELSVAPALLARVDWRGRVLTGDALFCQRTLCRQVRDAGGDYLLVVKDNQPALHADLALLFDPPTTVPAAPLTERREALTLSGGMAAPTTAATSSPRPTSSATSTGRAWRRSSASNAPGASAGGTNGLFTTASPACRRTRGRPPACCRSAAATGRSKIACIIRRMSPSAKTAASPMLGPGRP